MTEENLEKSDPMTEMSNKMKRELVLDELKLWSSAEQGVFLEEALKTVSLSLVKFVSTISNDMIANDQASNGDSNFSSIMEEQANDIAYFKVLNEKSTETKLRSLALYLPLLQMVSDRTLNEKLKDSYNGQVQFVLEECLFDQKFLHECREILLFAMAHPIFDSIQKLSFKKWWEKIDEISDESDQSDQSSSGNTIHTSFEDNGVIVNDVRKVIPADILKAETEPAVSEKNVISMRKHMFLEKAVSTPNEHTESRFFSNNLKKSNFMNSLEGHDKTESNSDFRTHNGILPPNSQTKTFNSNYLKNEHAGMKNITQWLKNIKLHKYTEFFINMTYDDLISLNDQKLMAANITLGARKKILNCIDKLKERSSRLKQLIQILDDRKCPINNSTLENILFELSEISLSPIEPNHTVPTSVNCLRNYLTDDLLNFNSSKNVCQLIIDLLERIQDYLLKQNQAPIKADKQLKELLKLCMKIIDKLFLTKAFSDIQNLHMAKQRASFNERAQCIQKQHASNEVLQPSYKTDQAAFNSYRTLQKSNSSFINKFDLNSGNLDENLRKKPPVTSTISSMLNQNSKNARQRIQNKTQKRGLGKTVSAPYYFHESEIDAQATNGAQFKNNPFFDE